MGGLILDFDAAENGHAAKDERFAPSSGKSIREVVAGFRAVRVSAENALAVGNDFPGFGDAQLAASANGVDGDFDGVLSDGGLAQVKLDAAENCGYHAALEVRSGNAALDATEESEFVESVARIAGGYPIRRASRVVHMTAMPAPIMARGQRELQRKCAMPRESSSKRTPTIIRTAPLTRS